MGFRRRKGDVECERRWRAFCQEHASAFREAGLPATIFSSMDMWQVFLMHGYFDGYSELGMYSTAALNDRQSVALVDLIARYYRHFGFTYRRDCTFGNLKYQEMLELKLGVSS